ncbi:hypothetical protein IWX49DRAFT_256730 [Phyllosticta citricarpa]|uniref:Chitin-binding type-1 domain-containing protein n=1 Tax=Phyllosticta paracitricarpa TaxID=2016321 RepID=A0ABR1NCE6_9PEZI
MFLQSILCAIFLLQLFQVGRAANNTTLSWNASTTASSPYPVDTMNATCGESAGFMCKSDGVSPCCSQFGQCGGTSEFCGSGCQSEFGSCRVPNATLGNPPCSWAGEGTSPRCDGRCGSQFNGSICNEDAGPNDFARYGVYQYGQCCSSSGFCGSTSLHCEADKGCQSGCDGESPSVSASGATATVTASGSQSTSSSEAVALLKSAGPGFGYLALFSSLFGVLIL